MEKGIPSLPALLRFLAGRQLAYVDPPESQDEEEEEEEDAGCEEQELGAGCEHVGFNGRWNKRVDTCYCWWVGGALKVNSPFSAPFPSRHTQLRSPPRSSAGKT